MLCCWFEAETCVLVSLNGRLGVSSCMEENNHWSYNLYMYPKRSGQGDGPVARPVRTSDRLRRRPKVFSRTYLYYTPTIIRSRKGKTKTRTAASRIAKMLCPSNRPTRSPNNNVSASICFPTFPFFYYELWWKVTYVAGLNDLSCQFRTCSWCKIVCRS